MARPLRLELAGGIYHVTSRGDRREDIFLNDADRLVWLEIFAQTCKRFNWVCHAWCLMDNHYHIVVETIEGNLAQGMRHLNGVYTQTFNRTHKRVGHVFQGRYKAIIVEKEGYLLELARYVVLNPLRAGMVKNIADWQWSSYAAMLGAQPAPEWLQTDWILGQFSPQRRRAINLYIDFVRAGVGLPSVWEQLSGQVFLGSDRFLKRMQAMTDKAAIGEIPRAQRRPVARPLDYYQTKHPDAKAAMSAAYATGDYTLQEIADHFGVHYATVSRAVKKGDEI
ncbi:REP-associated tyrosine transposase [Sideroxyarcus sp. TK5]